MVNPIRGTEDVSSFDRVEPDTVRESRGWFFALGIAFMILGGLAIVLPFVAGLVTTVVLGWLMIVGGLIQGFHAVQNRRWRGAAWAIVGAVLMVVAGGLVVAFPITGKLTLTLILAGFFIATGAVKIGSAIQHRSMPRWGWLLFDGLLTLALGVLIVAGWPGTAAWAIGVLVGVDFLVGGASMLMLGLATDTVLGSGWRRSSTRHHTATAAR